MDFVVLLTTVRYISLVVKLLKFTLNKLFIYYKLNIVSLPILNIMLLEFINSSKIIINSCTDYP